MKTVLAFSLALATAACSSSPTGPSATTIALVRRDLTYAINIPDPQAAETLRRIYPDGIYMSPMEAQARWDFTDLYHGSPNVYQGPGQTGGFLTYSFAGIVTAPTSVASVPTFPASAWPNEYGQYTQGVEYAWLGRFAYAIPRERP